MVILHIAFVTDNKANGVSIVVPKYVEEQSKYEEVGLLNLSNYNVESKIGNAKFFSYVNRFYKFARETF